MARLPKTTPPAEETATDGTVKMVREGVEPTTADVHPDEVENYVAGGWERA